ncbi:MAG TPA: hypothetical protein VGP25_05085 [Gemmatimonadaceae bacterium]|jgi:hypothetical protein|nr:hypothetical protein [Gemmatimonadaceae bacterium]
MRPALIVATIALTVACSSGDSVNKEPAGSVAGKWVLQTYNGNALPFTGSVNANGSVNRVDSGSITFDGKRKSYVLDIKIVNTLGSTVTPQDFAEVGSFAGNATTGVVLKPNDLSGGTSRQIYQQVPVAVSGNTLSLPQDGKILRFAKQ